MHSSCIFWTRLSWWIIWHSHRSDKVLVGNIFKNRAESLKSTHKRICREGDIIFCLDGISQFVSGDSLQNKTLNLLEWDIGRVNDWTSEWVRRPLRGYHAVFQLSSPSASKGEQGTKPIEFLFYKWGQFQKWWGILHRTPDIGWGVFISNSLVCFRLRKYILQTIPDQTRLDHIRPD